MSTEYGAVACDGMDPEMARVLCPNCEADDDWLDDKPGFNGRLIDAALLPALIVMGVAIAAMVASGSVWITVQCWIAILAHI